MALRQRVPGTFVFCTLILLSCAAAPLQAQAPRPANFLAEHYDVSASLDAIGQSISATTKIDFKAVEASSSVRVELHPNLIVALEGKRLAVGSFELFPDQIGLQLASQAPGGFNGRKIDLCRRGDGLYYR